MKKEKYTNYKKASDFFANDAEILKDEIESAEKQKKYVTWVQEFSKKVVVVVFIIYIISIIYNFVLVYLSFKTGNYISTDTLISEMNLTFREVIGGYIIKSAVENTFKIAGSYVVGIYDTRLKAIKYKLEKDDVIKSSDNQDNNSNDFGNGIIM